MQYLIMACLIYAVELRLYAPSRPIVDYSVIFLWMMAVGTVFCATLWSEFTATDETVDRYDELSPKVIMCQCV